MIDLNDYRYVKERFGEPLKSCPAPRAGKINPHVSSFLTKGGIVSVFHVKPIYYLHQNGEWRPLSEVCDFYGNHTISFRSGWDKKVDFSFLTWLIKRQDILGGQVLLPSSFYPLSLTRQRDKAQILFATTTVYPDPDTETTSVDGWSDSSNGSWSTAHGAATGDIANDSSTTLNAHVFTIASVFTIRRSFLLFDTSAISDASTISAGVLSIYPTTVVDGDNDANAYMAIVTSTPASNTAITTADYDQLGTTEQHDAGERKDLTSLGTGAYADFTFNSTGRGNISKSGVSKFGVREGHDINNDAITGTDANSGVNPFSASETSGTSQDPKLVVTTTSRPSMMIFD